MTITIKKSNKVGKLDNVVFLSNDKMQGLNQLLEPKELDFVSKSFKSAGQRHFTINQYNRFIFIGIVKNDDENYKTVEKYRDYGWSVLKEINQHQLDSITLFDGIKDANKTIAFIEGLVLSNYQFLKYFTNGSDKQNSLKEIRVISNLVSEQQIEELKCTSEGVYHARDLVNEPVSFLDSVKLSEEIIKLGKESGFNVEVFNKKKIESLKMGGILAVNQGSPTPPTFSILEWKPQKPLNKKPLILVGKGVVYDTGGLSLKPTPNSMDMMKSDMGGAATVVGTLYAIAKAKIPQHVIGLIPSTDNRPGQNAYAPGDVITMYGGTSVEVLNTDAEGRMLLADALTYAQKYSPCLTINLATLTGSAVRAIGQRAIVGMGNSESNLNLLETSGYNVFERIAKMPFWDDYAQEMKSKIADLKNLGGPYAGQITAGKFLEHFTRDNDGKSVYPWIHLDIAGPAFIPSDDTYRTSGGTGYGVRLLVDFIKNLTQ